MKRIPDFWSAVRVTAILFTLALSLPPLASAAIQLIVSTDQSIYQTGDTVSITATVRNSDGSSLTRIKKNKIEIYPPGSRRSLLRGTLNDQGNGLLGYSFALANGAAVGTWTAKVSIEDFSRNKAEDSALFEVSNGSPPPVTDADGDGVSDGNDQCPGTLTGSVVDGDGCAASQLDADQDGVTDDLDLCPGTPTGTTVDANGCPVTTPPPTDGHYGSDCVGCHGTEATEVHGSLHYQWQGPALDMVNQPGTPQGKLTNSVNSYCINILGNWNGCRACHVGKGAMPEAVATPSQLANIDCLKCHSQGGVLPTRADCLNCHAKAGGGDAVKRGDLALATGATIDRNYDVHMATTGANLQCQSCHTTRNHHIAGKGSDLRATDLDEPVTCTNCHSAAPHGDSNINKHTARVACQSCHIPVYAKDATDTSASEATETFRTWRSSNAAAAPFHPASEKANNLLPKYRFWNGLSDNYLLGDVANLDSRTTAYPTSRPLGSVQDGKLYPFKYKTAEQPMASGSRQLIAIDTGVFFATADSSAAINQGLVNMGMSGGTPWEWVLTDTFQLLNHQVSPKEQALQCSSCHGSTSRMNLKGELGYQLKSAKSTVCSQCHSDKNYSGYSWVHDKHVRDKKYDCSWCHTFSRPERGLRMP